MYEITVGGTIGGTYLRARRSTLATMIQKPKIQADAQNSISFLELFCLPCCFGSWGPWDFSQSLDLCCVYFCPFSSRSPASRAFGGVQINS